MLGRFLGILVLMIFLAIVISLVGLTEIGTDISYAVGCSFTLLLWVIVINMMRSRPSENIVDRQTPEMPIRFGHIVDKETGNIIPTRIIYETVGKGPEEVEILLEQMKSLPPGDPQIEALRLEAIEKMGGKVCPFCTAGIPLLAIECEHCGGELSSTGKISPDQ